MMIACRLFGPGLPVAGEPVTVSLDSGSLRVHVTPERRVAMADLAVSVGGFDHDELFLAWTDADGRWTVKPEGKAGREAFLSYAPEALTAQLRHWRRHTGAQQWVLRGVMASAAMFLVSVLLLWWKYDAALSWVAARISPETELKLGDAALEGLRENQTFLDKGEAVDVVRQMGSNLTKGSRYRYRWLVSSSKQVNAFALPGGIVVINRGLIEATQSADELAAVLAHEVQHVEQRHALKGMLNSVGVAAVLLVVLGDASAITAVMAHQAGSMAFGRDLESQADLDGVKRMQQAGIDGQGMVRMLGRLKEAA
ncbi:MAG TPA: M48 family metallopeptidase, partial [Fluviicoccus sp.]|nr:M48 family metallopeptidase [Fluviicoccus sp.]